MGDVDDAKPKVMLYAFLARKSESLVHPSHRPAKTQMPHLKRVANWRLEKNPGSDREFSPEFTTDRPASHKLTHLTQTILII